jgi:hypothetical protein
MDIGWLREAIARHDHIEQHLAEQLPMTVETKAKQRTGVINTSGLNPVDVFRALYSHAKKDENEAACDDPYEPGEIDYRQAERIVQERLDNNFVPYFARVRCRKMYVTILPDEIWADRYNQFNGEGVAQKVIAALRKIKGIPE